MATTTTQKDHSGEGLLKQHPLVAYFVLAFSFTWLILSPGVASALGLLDFQFDGTVLTFLSGIGPLLAALIVTGATEGGEGVRNIFRSMFRWQVGVGWWVAAVLMPAGLFALAIAIGILSGGPRPDPSLGVFLPGGSVAVVVILLLIGSFGEEPGWRGFALPRLQQGRSALAATLILTLFWWLWHLPAYWVMPAFVYATQQYGFLAAFGIQAVILLAMGLLLAWVYNGSSGSILMPVLLHASWNFWSSAFGPEASVFILPLFLLFAVVIGFATKGRLGLRSTVS